MTAEREVLPAKVAIVGAGPAGLACAYRLASLMEEHNGRIEREGAAGEKLEPEEIFVLEKGAAPGAHSLSGAVMDPVALQELVPDFEARGFPAERRVATERVFFLTRRGRFPLPVVPPPMRNHGNYVVSLNKVVQWLAGLVEEKGVTLLPGFPAQEVLLEEGRVVGVRSGDRGVGADGQRKANYEPGADIRAAVTVLAEGPRGHLMKHLTRELDLERLDPEMATRFGFTRGRANPQVYATALKEIWEVTPEAWKAWPWDVVHTMGYPLPRDVFGGSFIYRMQERKVALGLVVSLDAPDPLLDPHAYFQLFKAHPFIRKLLAGGKLIRYGAKTISEGGYFSVPRLAFEHALVVGECGGLVNVPRLKGIHYAIKSGILAAERIFHCLVAGDFSAAALRPYEEAVRDFRRRENYIGRELWRYRYQKANFQRGFWRGALKTGLQELLGGRWPGGQPEVRADHEHIRRLDEYGLPTSHDLWERSGLRYDNERLFFDRLTGVYHSGTVHEEDQPCHLVIRPEDVATICNDRCTREYGNPCQYFCPANVYEMVENEAGRRVLRINAANCVHCKTCDIRDPYQVITWVTPEGGGGPDYAEM